MSRSFDKLTSDSTSSSSSSNSFNSVTKCWVYVPISDSEIVLQAKQWVDSQNIRWSGNSGNKKKEYECIYERSALTAFSNIDEIEKDKFLEKVASKKPLKKVAENDILYIYCHGYIDKNSHEPTGEVGGDVGGKAYPNLKGKPEAKLKPHDLAKHLEEAGLNFNHKKLKLFACYSDKFAEPLSRLMSKNWPDLKVYGYANEVIPSGNNFGKMAGLTHEDALAYRKGDNKILLQVRNGDFKAKKHRTGYKDGLKIVPTSEQKLELITDKKTSPDVDDLAEKLSKFKLNKG